MKRQEQPMQPIAFTKDGVIRFRKNMVLCFLLEEAREGRKCDLNRIAQQRFSANWPADDVEQFWQMLGYSVSGYGDLSFVRRSTIKKADEIADKLIASRKRGSK